MRRSLVGGASLSLWAQGGRGTGEPLLPDGKNRGRFGQRDPLGPLKKQTAYARFPPVANLPYTFFRSFYAAGGCISLCCGWLFYRWGGGSLAPLLYFKLGTTAIVYYMVNRFKHREYYYYHNLGISKRKLWAFYEFCDLLVFVLLLIAADLLPEWDTFWR